MEHSTLPYCGPAPEAAGLWQAWNMDPPLLLASAGLFLAAGILRAGPAVFCGLLVLFLAFVSPLCALTTALFAARGLHHLLLISLAAPLLASGLAQQKISLPGGSRGGAFALTLCALALIAWHLPPVYQAIWQGVALYWLMQAALLLPAIWFWAFVIEDCRGGRFIAPAVLIAGFAMISGMIGAVLTFAPSLLYPQHGQAPLLYGLSPLEDQQLAGLVMWVPGSLPLAAIAAWALRRAWARQAAPELAR